MQVAYPKKTDKPLYHGLVTQLQSCNIPFLEAEDLTEGAPLKERFDVVIDAIFGFSFKGTPRPPFDKILEVRHSSNESGARLIRATCIVCWRGSWTFLWQRCVELVRSLELAIVELPSLMRSD